MQARVIGSIVKVDRYEWSYNNQAGVSYSIFVRPENGDESLPADKIRVSEQQFATFHTGDRVDVPVIIGAVVDDRTGGGKVTCKLPAEYVNKPLAGVGPKP